MKANKQEAAKRVTTKSKKQSKKSNKKIVTKETPKLNFEFGFKRFRKDFKIGVGYWKLGFEQLLDKGDLNGILQALMTCNATIFEVNNQELFNNTTNKELLVGLFENLSSTLQSISSPLATSCWKLCLTLAVTLLQDISSCYLVKKKYVEAEAKMNKAVIHCQLVENITNIQWYQLYIATLLSLNGVLIESARANSSVAREKIILATGHLDTAQRCYDAVIELIRKMQAVDPQVMMQLNDDDCSMAMQRISIILILRELTQTNHIQKYCDLVKDACHGNYLALGVHLGNPTSMYDTVTDLADFVEEYGKKLDSNDVLCQELSDIRVTLNRLRVNIAFVANNLLWLEDSFNRLQEKCIAPSPENGGEKYILYGRNEFVKKNMIAAQEHFAAALQIYQQINDHESVIYVLISLIRCGIFDCDETNISGCVHELKNQFQKLFEGEKGITQRLITSYQEIVNIIEQSQKFLCGLYAAAKNPVYKEECLQMTVMTHEVLSVISEMISGNSSQFNLEMFVYSGMIIERSKNSKLMKMHYERSEEIQSKDEECQGPSSQMDLPSQDVQEKATENSPEYEQLLQRKLFLYQLYYYYAQEAFSLGDYEGALLYLNYVEAIISNNKSRFFIEPSLLDCIIFRAGVVINLIGVTKSVQKNIAHFDSVIDDIKQAISFVESYKYFRPVQIQFFSKHPLQAQIQYIFTALDTLGYHLSHSVDFMDQLVKELHCEELELKDVVPSQKLAHHEGNTRTDVTFIKDKMEAYTRFHRRFIELNGLIKKERERFDCVCRQLFCDDSVKEVEPHEELKM